MMCINDTSETLDWEKKNPAGWQVFSVDSEALHFDTRVGGLLLPARVAMNTSHPIVSRVMSPMLLFGSHSHYVIGCPDPRNEEWRSSARHRTRLRVSSPICFIKIKFYSSLSNWFQIPYRKSTYLSYRVVLAYAVWCNVLNGGTGCAAP